MSTYTRRRQLQDSVEHSRTMLGKVEQEMAEGYLEVEIGGISFRRLVCAYTVGLRNAGSLMVANLRSLLRLNTAH